VNGDGGREQCRPALVQEADAFLDALQRPLHVAFETLEDADGVVIGASTDPIGVGVRVLDDPLALGFGRLGQATFVDEEGRLLLGSPDDPLCLFLRLLDDALALGIDPLGGADLFGDGDTELIDESEGGVSGRRQRSS
jgi:hypothetical protein